MKSIAIVGVIINDEHKVKTNTLPTLSVNSLFPAISFLSWVSTENKNGQPMQINQNFRWVVLTGLSSNMLVEDINKLI